MYAKTLFDPEALELQVKRQERYAWDLETGVPWHLGVDPNKPFLPLDDEAIVFPGASAEQRLAISQLLGLLINSSIGEMEDVIHKLKDAAWETLLRQRPVGPEFTQLGELFFEEEQKHSRAFSKYIELFCSANGMDREQLDPILPKVFGSLFLSSIRANSQWGGHAFWWVVAAVEEVSILFFKNLQPAKTEIDPLYYQVHLKHMEEESRHHNYAFMMLEWIGHQNRGLSTYFHSKTDLIFGQIFSTSWMLAEMAKIFEAKKFKKAHPFFEVIASCEPLFKKLPKWELARRLFVTAPHVSLVLNPHFHKKTQLSAKKQGVFSIPMPRPRLSIA